MIGAENYLGTIILIGLLVAIPAALVGYFWAVKVGTKIEVPEDGEEFQFDYDEIIKSFGKMPSTLKSFLPIVLPIVLIGVGSEAALLGGDDIVTQVLRFVGSPTVALLIGVLASFPLLPEMSEKTLSGWIGDGLKEAAPILLITGAGGSFGRVISNTGVAELIQSMNLDLFKGALFLLVPFIIAAALKTAQGSTTTALVVTSTLIAPLLSTLGIEGAIPVALIAMANRCWWDCQSTT